jgi:hypothetical protein
MYRPNCHGFPKETITYNANRIDRWVADAWEVFKQTKILKLFSTSDPDDPSGGYTYGPLCIF